jgi:glycosyltransferase involved in cell wall biosynthesis
MTTNAQADDLPPRPEGDADRSNPPAVEAPTASAAEPITVVFFDGSPTSYGGGSEMLARLLTRLDASRFEPILLTQQRDRLCRRLDGAVRIEVVPFPGSLDRYDGAILDQPLHRTFGTGLRLLQYNVRARHVLAEADVLWCANLRSVLTVGPTTEVRETPVIWNVGLGQPSTGVYRYLNELGLGLADRVFVESDRQARRLFTDGQYDAHADALEIFPKGIDAERFAVDRTHPQLAGETVTIGTVASITPRKGLEFLIEAAIQLLDERSEPRDNGDGGSADPRSDQHSAVADADLEFLIAGAPPHESDERYAEALRRRVAHAGYEEAISFLGWVEDVPAFYERLDAFVLPSRNEGVPGALREAMASGLPAVATDVGGTREVVRDGETGILVEPEDAAALAGALRSLLADPEWARELATAGRALVRDRFSVEAYVERYESFLREVAE